MVMGRGRSRNKNADSAVKLIEMVNALNSMSNQISFDDLMQSSYSLFDIIANALIVRKRYK